MHRTFGFEKLEVYRQAKDLIKEVYRLTRSFPAEERYGLTSQIRRAALSVASNLAEGQGRLSRRDQAHFSQMAYSSLMEVLCQSDIAHELGYLGTQDLEGMRPMIEILAMKLSALHSSQVDRKDSSS